MLMAVFYKEWLKLRWFLLLYTLLGIIAITYIFLALKHSFDFSGIRNIWGAILFQGNQFYEIFKFVPLAGGVIVALAQYLPEISNKRIKLAFHLPLEENKVLLAMQALGAGCLFIAFLIFIGLIGFISLAYFPIEIVGDSVVTILPWLLAGFSAYFIVAFVVLEPSWVFRFLYSLIGTSFLFIHFLPAGIAGYGPATTGLSVLCVLLACSSLFTGYRFRKGEN